MDTDKAMPIKHVQFHDIMSYNFLSSSKISPNGQQVAFIVHRGDIENNCYRSCIWLCNLEKEKDANMQLTFTGKERTFCWNTTGDGLLFLSGREQEQVKSDTGKKSKDSKADKKFPGLYSLSLRGGEARLLAELPRYAMGVWDLGNGNILLLTDDPRDTNDNKFEDADYLVIQQIPFSANGHGFTAQRRARLSLLKLNLSCDEMSNNAKLEDLTPETMDVGAVRVSLSHDTKNPRVYFTAVDYTDMMPITTGVWELDIETRELKNLLPQGVYRWSCVAPLNNSNNLLAVGTDMKRYGLNENRKFYILDNSNKSQIECLTPDIDTSLHNSVISDCRMGCDSAATFIIDSFNNCDTAWFITTKGYHSSLCTVDTHGTVNYIPLDDIANIRSVDDFDVRNGQAVIVALTGLNLPELYLVTNSQNQANIKQLTGFNTRKLEGLDLSVPEYVRVENGTPEGIDCWYMRPVRFEVGKKYPTILNIHGGPKMAYSDTFDHEMQCWAALGFAVLFCNPRGGDGRGNAFADIRGKYGYEDYNDLMTFVDWAIQTLPFVDGDRIGVTGGSYGGFMTNWIIGHTDRFRAAVTQRSICNWISMAGMSDIGYFFVKDQQAADLGEDINTLWEHSPLKYANQMRTPTLVIHSDEDHRCELGQGLQMITALKRNGVESRMCLFKGENHELSRSGHPKSRLARLQEITRWMTEKL